MKIHAYKICSNIAILITCFIFPSVASSIEAMTEQEMTDANNDSQIEANPSDKKVDEAIDAWFSKRNIQEGEIRKGGKIYYRATEIVSVDPASPAWPKARQISFEKAILSAQADFIKGQFGHSITKLKQHISSDDSSDNYEFKEKPITRSSIASIWDKMVALGDEKLNQLLVENGVDPAQFDTIPPSKRKDLFVNSFIKQTVTKAMGDSSGLLTVQSFEGSDSSGSHAIGIILLYSPKLKQLAYDMANGREPLLKGKKGSSIKSFIDFSSEVLSNQFGLRVVFDELGDPVILSYGQWGYGYKGTNKQKEARMRKMAEEQASVKAIEQLTSFMNSSISLNKESETGEIIENYLLKTGDDITENNITTLVDKMTKSIRLKSKGSLSGTRTLKRWAYDHPYGHKIVGRVTVWSYKGLTNSSNIKNFKPAIKKESSDRNKFPNNKSQAQTNQGKEFVDPEESF